MKFRELLEVLPPPSQPKEIGNPGAWIKVERSLRIEVPDDYKAFISTYGTGWIGKFIIIWNPFAKNNFVNFNHRMMDFLDGVKIAKQGKTLSDIKNLFPYTFFPESSSLLPFASSINGDIFFWDTTHNDVNDWNIIINRTRSSIYEKYDMGLSNFLYGVMISKVDTFITFTDFDRELGFQQKFIE